MIKGSTLVYAAIGGVTTWIVVALGTVFGVSVLEVPYVAVIGGAVAGYLRGGDRVDGGKVGGFSALVTIVPLVPAVVIYLEIARGTLEAIQFGGYWGQASAFLFVIITIYGVALLTIVSISGIVGGVIGSRLKTGLASGR